MTQPCAPSESSSCAPREPSKSAKLTVFSGGLCEERHIMFGTRSSALVVFALLLNACAAQQGESKSKAPEAASDTGEGSGSGEIDESGGPATGIDLAVTRVFWSPAHPKAGQALTFSATVKNQGTVATPEGTIIGVAFQINGNTVSWSDTSKASLGPGETRKLTANFGPGDSATWTAIAGEHTLGAWVDDVKRVDDTNLNNNTNETPLVVQ